MLPAAHRLTRSSDFAVALRGRRVRSGPLVVHWAVTENTFPPRLGLVVNRQVGGSVARHRVARRLRAALSAHLQELPAGTLLVVRALPEAAAVSYAAIAAALEDGLRRLSRH